MHYGSPFAQSTSTHFSIGNWVTPGKMESRRDEETAFKRFKPGSEKPRNRVEKSG